MTIITAIWRPIKRALFKIAILVHLLFISIVLRLLLGYKSIHLDAINNDMLVYLVALFCQLLTSITILFEWIDRPLRFEYCSQKMHSLEQSFQTSRPLVVPYRKRSLIPWLILYSVPWLLYFLAATITFDYFYLIPQTNPSLDAAVAYAKKCELFLCQIQLLAKLEIDIQP